MTGVTIAGPPDLTPRTRWLRLLLGRVPSYGRDAPKSLSRSTPMLHRRTPGEGPSSAGRARARAGTVATAVAAVVLVAGCGSSAASGSTPSSTQPTSSSTSQPTTQPGVARHRGHGPRAPAGLRGRRQHREPAGGDRDRTHGLGSGIVFDSQRRHRHQRHVVADAPSSRSPSRRPDHRPHARRRVHVHDDLAVIRDRARTTAPGDVRRLFEALQVATSRWRSATRSGLQVERHRGDRQRPRAARSPRATASTLPT